MNLTRIENKLIVLSQAIGVSTYDFNFELHFECDHPYQIDREMPCVLRIGPVTDYEAEYRRRVEMGLRLVNSPLEHAFASELENWYPLISPLTPRTRLFDELPSSAEIESEFEWPVFMKGSRQTSKHNPDLSIIQNADHYVQAAQRYRADPILHWQKPVIREYISLARVAGSVPGKIAPSVEYRSFWWHAQCVAWGRYWFQVAPYHCPDVDAGLAVAQQAAACLNVPFLVVDFAKTEDGRWIIIEPTNGS